MDNSTPTVLFRRLLGDGVHVFDEFVLHDAELRGEHTHLVAGLDAAIDVGQPLAFREVVRERHGRAGQFANVFDEEILRQQQIHEGDDRHHDNHNDGDRGDKFALGGLQFGHIVVESDVGDDRALVFVQERVRPVAILHAVQFFEVRNHGIRVAYGRFPLWGGPLNAGGEGVQRRIVVRAIHHKDDIVVLAVVEIDIATLGVEIVGDQQQFLHNEVVVVAELGLRVTHAEAGRSGEQRRGKALVILRFFLAGGESVLFVIHQIFVVILVDLAHGSGVIHDKTPVRFVEALRHIGGGHGAIVIGVFLRALGEEQRRDENGRADECHRQNNGHKHDLQTQAYFHKRALLDGQRVDKTGHQEYLAYHGVDIVYLERFAFVVQGAFEPQ